MIVQHLGPGFGLVNETLVVGHFPQLQGGAGHVGIIVGDAGAALEMGEAVAVAQQLDDPVERLGRRFNPLGRFEHHAGAGNGRNGQAVPAGQHAVVAGGRGALGARGQQHGTLLGQQGLVGFVGRHGVAQAARQVAAHDIAVAGDAIDLFEAGRECAHQGGVDLCFAPSIELGVFGMGARGDGGGEYIAYRHLTQQEGDGLGHALAAQLIAVELPDRTT